jgi:alkanesulfonate monooxygenase SsuD/methylene tetrahydromethanopterin reductase-like flavin-dependent oxidoreductase (luciferase family)
MRPRALALAAQRADGWEASFLPPVAFADVSARVDLALAAAGRPRNALRRSVEIDAALADTPAEAVAAIEEFCSRRGIAREHPLLQGALAGDVDAVIARVLAYRQAGATDLMIGFADFPDTTMLERFAARVLPALSARGA